MSGAVIFLTVSVVFAQGMKEMGDSKGAMMGEGMMDDKGGMKGMMGEMDKESDKTQGVTPAASDAVNHESHH